MNTLPTPKFRTTLLVSAALLALPSTWAATKTWNQAGGGDFNTAGNWTTSGVPGVADTGLFNIAISAPVTLSASATPLNLTFDTNVSSFTLGAISGNPLNVQTAGKIEMLVGVLGTNKTVTVNAPVVLGGGSSAVTYAFNNNATDSTNTLVFGDQISGGTTLTSTLTLGGTNTGANSLNGNVVNGSGTVAVSKSGAGAWTLAGTGNSYTGATTVSAGTLNLTGSLTGGTAISVTGGTFKEGGTGAISGASAITVNGAAATATLAGTNTYTGATTLTNGTLNINSAGALGSGTLTLTSNSQVAATVDNTSGAAVTSQSNNPAIIIGSASFAGAFTFGGTNDLNLGTGAISLNPNSVITLNGTGSTLTLGGLATSTAANLAEVTTVNGSGNTLVLGGYALAASGNTSAVNNSIAGNGNVTLGNVTNGGFAGSGLTYKGAGTLTLAGAANTYTGATNVNSGSVLLTGALTGTSGVSVAGGSFTETGAGVIGTAASTLSVSGGGMATLSGINTYTGSTTVGAGTLNLDFSGATAPSSATNIIKSTNTLNLNGGKLAIKGGGSGAANSQAFATTALTAGTSSSVVFNQNGATSLGATLGNLTRGAASTVDITLPTTGTVTVTNTTQVSNGVLVSAASNGVAFATANGGATWASNTAGTLGALASYGTGNANYTTTQNVDVANGDTPASGVTVNTLRFSGSNIGLTLAGTNIVNTGGILVTPGSTGATISGGTLTGNATGKELVLVDYGSVNIGSAVANNGANAVALTHTGTGTTTLSGANSYSGVTTVNTGTLRLSGSNSSAGTATVNSAGTLQLAGTTANNGGLASGTLTLNAGGTLQVASAAPLALSNTVALTTSGTISGAQDLTLNGALSPTNTATLTNSITGGKTLALGTVNIGATTSSGFTLTLTGSGNTTVSGAINDYSGGAGTTAGKLTYSGSGALTLNGTNTYTGTTTIMGGGTLTLAGSNAAATPASLVFGVAGAGGTFNFDNTGSVAAKNQSFGALSVQGGDAIVQTTRTANQDELLTFASTTRSAGSTVNFSNGGGTNSATNGFVITAQTANAFMSQGTFFGGSNYAWYDGGGFVRAVNYGVDAGTATSAGATSLTAAASSNQTTGAVTAQATGQTFLTLNLAGTSTTAGNNDFTLASGATATISGILRSGNVAGSNATISGGLGFSASSGKDLVIRTDGVNDSLTINTAIIGGNVASNGGLVKSGAGTLTMGTLAVNSYFGGTALNQGTLNISQDSNLGANWSSLNLVAGTLQAGAANVTLNSSRLVNLTATGAGQTIDTQANNMTILGSIMGGASTGTLTKTGSGTLTLGGTNTYVSATSVANGTLSVTGSLASPSVVNVASGATLRGTGTIGGATTLTGGATLAAGINTSTIGALTFSSTLDVTAATVSLKLNSTGGTFDSLVANGLTLGNAMLSLAEIGNGTWTGVSTFTLVNNTSNGSVSGTFFGLAEGASVAAGSNVFTISYVGGTGNDITLTTSAVPEPATYAAFLGTLVLAVTVVRRRRSRQGA